MTDHDHDDRDRPLLSVDDLHVQFTTSAGVVKAVDGVSFDVARGQSMAILGESGSGKSVTAQAIMGLVAKPAGTVTGGKILFEGVGLLRQSATYTRRLRGQRVAMVFQDPLSSLNPVFRVGYQIAEMFRRHRGASRREAKTAAIDLMRRVGIPDAAKRANDYPHQFSGGMRQRSMIAMALALDPVLLIADEPTTALDVTVQAQIMELLRDLRDERGMALILISHDLGVVADAADRVTVMYAGHTIEQGELREVYDHQAHPYTRGLMNSIPRLDQSGGRLTPITGSPPDLLALPPGCPFQPRCGLATPTCSATIPQLRPAGRPDDHQSACHYAEEALNEREAV
jgi:oligopeptide/dipeptide ABC transporter ATP-binding protein